MSKIIDITDKLNFEESPSIKIKDRIIRINDDAASVVKLMGKIGDGTNMNPEVISESSEILFGEEGIMTLSELRLGFSDYVKVVEAAVELIVGDDEGELESATTTSLETGI